MQLRSGVPLAHPVQIEARIDGCLAGRDLARRASVEPGEGSEGCFRDRRRWTRRGRR
jgi:hypothetical protein